jgi:hypothetical protein
MKQVAILLAALVSLLACSACNRGGDAGVIFQPRVVRKN